ncbi:hypothetical protein EC957_010927 [Mortierella hygrophila]|uniref:Uncharacterized protein n=1 Tax=Mortierella hygrophila TaxID=979708 RepID=A0A9P6K470_9FUNG|nr:hypothetical protein EC957_010927 [Mortierella hygrophila]
MPRSFASPVKPRNNKRLTIQRMPCSELDTGKQRAKRLQDLAILLSTIDTQVSNATACITTLFSRCKTVVLGIHRRATEAINITNTTYTIDITNATNTTSTEILSEVG